jgi:hypothetical protein
MFLRKYLTNPRDFDGWLKANLSVGSIVAFAIHLDPAPGRGYISAMPPRRTSKKDSPKKLAGRMKRRWRVVLLRAKGEILGQVEAHDAASAKAAAVVHFDLDEIQRNRIIVQELG